MKKPIIEIKTANEAVTKKLIELGILFEDEIGNRQDWGEGAYLPDEIFEVLRALA